MSRSTHKRKSNRRRNPKNKPKQARNVASLLLPGSNTMNVLPRNFRRTLRYVETFSLTTGAAGIIGSVQSMTLNSLYDPNQTGTGHQPYGFDQLSSFYNKFIVHKCRYRLLCTTIGGTPEIGVCFQVVPTGSSTITGISLDAATEKSMCTVFPVGPSGNDRARLVQGSVQMHQVFGIKKAQYADNLTAYAGSSSGNPSQAAYLIIGCGSYSGTAGESLSVQVILDFDAEFFDPIQMAQS